LTDHRGPATVRWDAHLERVERGEPADRARQVDVVEEFFPAVAFQLGHDPVTTGPPAQHAAERAQQQIVDARPVGDGGIAH
jgi:hypothetical protein